METFASRWSYGMKTLPLAIAVDTRGDRQADSPAPSTTTSSPSATPSSFASWSLISTNGFACDAPAARRSARSWLPRRRSSAAYRARSRPSRGSWSGEDGERFGQPARRARLPNVRDVAGSLLRFERSELPRQRPVLAGLERALPRGGPSGTGRRGRRCAAVRRLDRMRSRSSRTGRASGGSCVRRAEIHVLVRRDVEALRSSHRSPNPSQPQSSPSARAINWHAFQGSSAATGSLHQLLELLQATLEVRERPLALRVRGAREHDVGMQGRLGWEQLDHDGEDVALERASARDRRRGSRRSDRHRR